MKRFFSLLGNEVATGLVLLAPIVGTIYLIVWLVRTVDGVVPDAWRPHVMGVPMPGLGIVVVFALATLFGLAAHYYAGQRLVGLLDALFARMPIFGSTYGLMKQIFENVFAKDGQSFRRAVLVEYPSAGSYAIAFVTSDAPPPILSKGGRELLSVFVPTTPNPTSGFYLLVERERARELEMSVADAFKLVVSMGIAKEPEFLTTTAKLRMPPAGSN